MPRRSSPSRQDRTSAAPVTQRYLPLWPLIATVAVQMLATMTLFSVPAIAPEIASDLHISGTLVGAFVAAAYGTGIISALLSPGLIHRYGGVRATQAVLVAAAGMVMVVAGISSVFGFALGAVVLGLGYGAAAPASAHLLVPRTPRPMLNMVMSLRQIGVPLGGVLGSLVLPPLTLAIGWRSAMLAELVPMVALIALLELPRPRWDADRNPNRHAFGRTVLQPFAMLRISAIRRLAISCFIYSGTQLSFVAFTTVQLTTTAGFDLVSAARMLAAYQVAGTLSRPIWGWVADRWLTPRSTLATLGVGMAVAATLAGHFSAGWSPWLILTVILLAGCTAGGYTGVAYAEFAALGGARRTEATGLGTAVMFTAVMLIPPLFGFAVGAAGGYAIPFLALAGLGAVSAVVQLLPPR